MNMTRQFGWKAGLATFVCDALKGGLPVLAVYLLYKDCIFIKTGLLVSDYVRYFSAVFVVIGHIFPVTMNFRGGKGIASTLGAYWVALSCESFW
jgi:glycerol-3-phosphate acyltransferase PlsY